MFERVIKKIPSEATEAEVYKAVQAEKTEFNRGIVELSEKVKNGESFDSVIEDIKDGMHEVLLKIIEHELRVGTISFIESEYLRDMALDEFKYCMEYSMNNIVANKEAERTVADHLHIDRKRLGCLIKFMNTINDLIIVKRFTKANFVEAMYDLFRLEATKVDYIWILFNDNKETLVTSALLSAITSIRKVNNNIDILNRLLSRLDDE